MQRPAAPADGFLLSVLLLDSLGVVPLSGGSQESTSEARIAFGSSTALLVVEAKRKTHDRSPSGSTRRRKGNRRADVVSCLNGYHRAKDWHWSQRQGTIIRSEVKQHVRDQSKTSGEFGGRKYRSKIKPAG
ncbi:hypothetical protein B0T09DRAFT_320356 [Sordaria sp. MPI-SDFR-AT-0083]|nr:hypothetical protein B0T09DRAFT_320356 [Sordaria sp. MPI-SDFR-AT-0083]